VLAPTLRILSGPLAGRGHEISAPIVVGRAEADIVVMDPEISRRHFRVAPVADGVEIVDLSSSNGTWVDGTRLSGPATLTGATAVRAGQTSFEVIPGDLS
jgi:pSer/pThr/pTyr-binding forkhead associated (FHA) protein